MGRFVRLDPCYYSSGFDFKFLVSGPKSSQAFRETGPSSHPRAERYTSHGSLFVIETLSSHGMVNRFDSWKENAFYFIVVFFKLLV